MSGAFALLAALLIAYSVLRLPERPGLFAGVIAGTYNLSIYFGVIGAPVGLFALVVAAARVATARERPLLIAEASLLGWAGLCLVGTLYAAQIEPALSDVMQMIGFVVPSYLYGRAFGNHPRFVPDFILSCALLLLVCEPGILLALGQRSSRYAGDLNAVGMSILLDVPLVACITRLMLDDTLSRGRAVGLTALLLLVLLPIGFLLGTRGVFAAAGVAFALLLARRLMEGRRRRLAIALVFALGAIVLAWTAMVTLGDARFSHSAMRLLYNFRVGKMLDTSSQQRLGLYGQAIKLIARAPFFGHGLGSFSVLADEGVAETVPHNIFLEILTSTGLAGLVLFLGGLLPILAASLKAMFRRPLDWTAAFAGVALVDSLMRHQFSMSVMQGKVLFLLMGLAVARTYPLRAASGLPSSAGQGESAPQAP